MLRRGISHFSNFQNASTLVSNQRYHCVDTSSKKLKILVLDGYSPEGRKNLTDYGVTTAGELYERMLTSSSPLPLEFTRVFPCDEGHEKHLGDLSTYDAVAWTGCSLTVYSGERNVVRQLDYAKLFFDIGVPQFGSCWGLQIAVAAAGGHVSKSPKGREMGVGRKVLMTAEGRSHPLYTGKTTVFDAFMSHDDEVTHMPPNSLTLASNPWSAVQAGIVRMKRGEFWAVQYHPEYDLNDMALLIGARLEKLTKLNIFKTEEDGKKYVKELLELHNNRDRKDLAWKLGVDLTDLSENVRFTECRNWLLHQVIPFHLYKHSRK